MLFLVKCDHRSAPKAEYVEENEKERSRFGERAPSLPDTFRDGSTVDFTLPQRDNELVRQT